MSEFEAETNFYELSELRPVVDDLPMTSFFEETRFKANEHTFGSWLKTANTDTIKMIIQTGEKTLWGDEDKWSKQDENDAIDYLYLVLFALGFELQSGIIPKDLLDKGMISVFMLAVGEDLLRMGLCTVSGTNSLLDDDTMLEATPDAKLVLEEIERRKKK